MVGVVKVPFLVLLQEPKVAFEDIDGYELYPCVVFYSSNPGEKVFFTVLLCIIQPQYPTDLMASVIDKSDFVSILYFSLEPTLYCFHYLSQFSIVSFIK